MRTYDMRAGEAGEVEHRQPESRMLRPRWVLLFAPIICAMLVSRVRVLMSVVHANKLQFYESCCFLACAVLSSSETTCVFFTHTVHTSHVSTRDRYKTLDLSRDQAAV